MNLNALQKPMDAMRNASAVQKAVAGGGLIASVGIIVAILADPMVAIFVVVVVLVVLGLLFGLTRVAKWWTGRGKNFGEEEEALDDAAKRWRTAIDEFERTGADRYTIPFYMLVGEPQGGKTTSAKNAGLHFPVGTDELAGDIAGTPNCNWLFTDDAILLDTAGRYTFKDATHNENLNEREWREFLKRLRGYRPRCPINGVVAVIPCDKLLTDSIEETARKAEVLRGALTEIQQELEIRFPVYVLLTKADYIGGFTEFFGHLRGIDQLQLVGWSHQTQDPKSAALDKQAVDEAFSSLTTRLEQWRLTILNNRRRDLSRDELDRLLLFPAEIQQLVEPLSAYLLRMFRGGKLVEPLNFRGLYVSSAVQQGIPSVWAGLRALGIDSTEGLDDEFPAVAQRSFFLRDFYTKKVFPEAGLIKPTKGRIKRVRLVQRVGYMVIAGVTVIGVFVATAKAFEILDKVGDPSENVAAAAEIAETKVQDGRNAVDQNVIDAIRQLDSVEAAIANGDLNTGEWNVFSGGVKENFEDSIWRLRRALVIGRGIRPVRAAIMSSLTNPGTLELHDAEYFDRYMNAIHQFVQSMAASKNDELQPETIRDLMLHFASLHNQELVLDSEGRPVVNAIIDSYANLYETRKRSLNDEEPWNSTAIQVVWSEYPNISDNLNLALDSVNARWTNVFEFEKDAWIQRRFETDPSRDFGEVEYWWKIVRIEGELDRARELLFKEADNLAAIDGLADWDAAAEQFIKAYIQFDSACAEFDQIRDVRPSLTADLALDELGKQWRDGFYDRINIATDDTRIAVVIDQFRGALENGSWARAVAEYERVLPMKGDAGSSWFTFVDGHAAASTTLVEHKRLFRHVARNVYESLDPLAAVDAGEDNEQLLAIVTSLRSDTTVLSDESGIEGEISGPARERLWKSITIEAAPDTGTSLAPAFMVDPSSQLEARVAHIVKENETLADADLYDAYRRAAEVTLQRAIDALQRIVADVTQIKSVAAHQAPETKTTAFNAATPSEFADGATERVAVFAHGLASWCDAARVAYPKLEVWDLLTELDGTATDYLGHWRDYWTKEYQEPARTEYERLAKITTWGEFAGDFSRSAVLSGQENEDFLRLGLHGLRCVNPDDLLVMSDSLRGFNAEISKIRRDFEVVELLLDKEDEDPPFGVDLDGFVRVVSTTPGPLIEYDNRAQNIASLLDDRDNLYGKLLQFSHVLKDTPEDATIPLLSQFAVLATTAEELLEAEIEARILADLRTIDGIDAAFPLDLEDLDLTSVIDFYSRFDDVMKDYLETQFPPHYLRDQSLAPESNRTPGWFLRPDMKEREHIDRAIQLRHFLYGEDNVIKNVEIAVIATSGMGKVANFYLTIGGTNVRIEPPEYTSVEYLKLDPKSDPVGFHAGFSRPYPIDTSVTFVDDDPSSTEVKFEHDLALLRFIEEYRDLGAEHTLRDGQGGDGDVTTIRLSIPFWRGREQTRHDLKVDVFIKQRDYPVNGLPQFGLDEG